VTMTRVRMSYNSCLDIICVRRLLVYDIMTCSCLATFC